MGDRMERLLVLPFSLGCSSRSSVELGRPTGPKADAKSIILLRRQAKEKRSSRGKLKTSKLSSGFLALPSPNISGGIRRLIRRIKTLSHNLFYYKEETQEMEPEMEIGYPTDVKHVTHIGLDGSTTTTILKASDFSFSSLSSK